MNRRRATAGLTTLELVLVLALAGILGSLSFTHWRGYTAQRNLRYGVVRVATDLRQAQERAKSERVPYTVTFSTLASGYTIAGGGFTENTTLPAGTVVVTGQVVTFDAFGRPGAAYTITVQGPTGTGTAMVNATGGITYQAP